MRRRWRALSRLLEGSQRLIALSLTIAVVQAALLIPIALLVQQVFNHSIPDGDTTQLLWSGAIMLALFLSSSALGLLTRWYSLRATKRAVTSLRATLVRKVLSLPQSYVDRAETGTLHSTLVQDSERLDLMANGLVAIVLPSATVSLALLAGLIAMDPLLSAVLVGTVPLMIVAGRPVARRLRARTRAWQRSFDVYSTQTQLTLRASALIKLTGAADEVAAERTAEIGELGEAGRMMAWLQTAYGQLHGTVSAVAAVLVLIVGGTAVADGRMPLGDLVAFYALLGILRGQVTTALVTAPQVISGWQSLSRLEAILDEPAHEPYSGTRRIDFSGRVTVERVEFAYGEDPVLHGVDLDVRPGETVALLGPNGAGKSTIISLLAGLYAPTRGRLLADEVPYEEIDLPELRHQIGVIQQDPLIFPTSVRENIAYGNPEADDRTIMRAAEQAGADRMIERLPAKLDEHVGDDGTRLSGGQRQRIALARALLGEPRLLMLDEPTTYLDEAGAMSVLGSLTSKRDSPAILIVSHDPLVKRVADRVLMLRDGLIEDETVRSVQPADIGASEAHR